MARPFNLTAQLNLQGPAGIRPVVQKLKRELGGIKADLKINIDRRSAKGAELLNKRVNALTQSLVRANSEAKTLSNTMASIGNVFTRASSASNKASKGVDRMTKSAGDAGKELRVAKTEMAEFGRVSGLALRRFAGFTVATGAIFGFVGAVRDAVGQAIAYERELIKISQVTGKTVGSLGALNSEITRLSTGFGVASQDLIEVSRILAQTGLSARDTKTALEALAKSSLAPTFTDIKNTTEGAVAAISQFGIGANQLEGVLGSLNAVAGSFAVEADDLISVIRRTGGVFKAASGDISAPTNQLNELVSIFTSVRATTRESADSIATGLRTIFTRIQRPRTIEFLRQFGIELQNTQGQFIGTFNAFQRLSDGLKGLNPQDIRFAQIVEEIGGFRQVGKLIPAIQKFAVAQDALKVATAGQGSLAADAASAQAALAVQFAKTRENFQALIRDFSQSTTFNVLAKGILTTADALISLASSLKPIIPALTALAAVKGISFAKQFTGGFIGGLRSGGEGAGGVGRGIGSTLTGGGGKEAAVASRGSAVASNQLAAVTKLNIDATSLNTRALTALTTKLNTFGAGLVGGGLGRVRRFNTGGMVPGTGSTDTVPAMLTPGEFVIRKSSVAKYGANNLANLNRGGKVPGVQYLRDGDLVDDLPEQGGLFANKATRTRGGLSFTQGQLPKQTKTFVKAGGAFLSPLGIDRDTSGFIPISKFSGKTKTAVKQKFGEKGVRYELVAGSLDTADANQFEDTLRDKLVETSMAQAQRIFGALRSDFDEAKFSRAVGAGGKFNFEQVSGNVFEAMLASAVEPFGGEKIKSNAPFDFPGGLGATSKFFDEELKSIPTDAKRSFSIKALASLGNKIKDRVIEDVEGGRPINIVKRNSGGSIPGMSSKDTVPAMLTPGEFVMSKPAVNRVGLGTLRGLNKGSIKGFNKGGFVQGFNDGGSVSSVSGAVTSFRGLDPAAQRTFQQTFGPLYSATNETAAQLKGFTRELQKSGDVEKALTRAKDAGTNSLKGNISQLKLQAKEIQRSTGVFGKLQRKFGKIGAGGGLTADRALIAATFAAPALQAAGGGFAGEAAISGIGAGTTASLLGAPTPLALGIGALAGGVSFAQGQEAENLRKAQQTEENELKEAIEAIQDYRDGFISGTEAARELRDAQVAALQRLNADRANFGGESFFTRRSRNLSASLGFGNATGTFARNEQGVQDNIEELLEGGFLNRSTVIKDLRTRLRRGQITQGEFDKESQALVREEAIGRLTKPAAEGFKESGAFQATQDLLKLQITELGQKLPTKEELIKGLDVRAKGVIGAGDISQFGQGNALALFQSNDIFENLKGVNTEFLKLAQGSRQYQAESFKLRQETSKALEQSRSNAERQRIATAFVKKLIAAQFDYSISAASAYEGQQKVNEALNVSNERLNLLGQRLSTFAAILGNVKDNLNQSIGTESARLASRQGNFTTFFGKSEQSRFLANTGAFTGEEANRFFSRMEGLFGARSVLQRSRAEERASRLEFGESKFLEGADKDVLKKIRTASGRTDLANIFVKDRFGGVTPRTFAGGRSGIRPGFTKEDVAESDKLFAQKLKELEQAALTLKKGDERLEQAQFQALPSAIEQIIASARGFTTAQREIPSILADAIQSQKDLTGEAVFQPGSDPSKTIADNVFQALTDGRFRDVISTKQAESISKAIEKETLGRQFSVDEFLNRTGLVESLDKGGKLAQDTLKATFGLLDENAAKFAKAIDSEVKIINQANKIKLQAIRAEQQFVLLRAKVGGKQTPIDTGLNAFNKEIRQLTRGTFARVPGLGFTTPGSTTDPQAIKRRIETLDTFQSGLQEQLRGTLQRTVTPGEAGDKARIEAEALAQRLVDVGTESNNLKQALQKLGASTEVLANLNAQAAQLERDKQRADQTLGNLLTSDIGQLREQARSLQFARQFTEQGGDINKLSPEQRRLLQQAVQTTTAIRGEQAGGRLQEKILKEAFGETFANLQKQGIPVPEEFFRSLGQQTDKVRELNQQIEDAEQQQKEALRAQFELAQSLKSSPEAIRAAIVAANASIIEQASRIGQEGKLESITVTGDVVVKGNIVGQGANLTNLPKPDAAFNSSQLSGQEFREIQQNITSANVKMASQIKELGNTLANIPSKIDVQISPDSVITLGGDTALAAAIGNAIKTDVTDELIAQITPLLNNNNADGTGFSNNPLV